LSAFSSLLGGLLRFQVGFGCLILALEYSYYAFGFSDLFVSLSVFNGYYGYVGDVVLWFGASALLMCDGLIHIKHSLNHGGFIRVESRV